MKTYSWILVFVWIPAALSSVIQVPGDQPTIQAGIDAAQPADTVLVAPGVYTGPGNRDIDFTGKDISVISLSGWETCSIDCQGTQAENHRGFIFHTGETSTAMLAGFTIMNGYEDGQGGGILFEQNSSPSVHQCRITMNTADQGAGIMCKSGASPQLVDCMIDRNYADYMGGGFELSQSNIQMTGCYIQFNRAEYGGGMTILYDSAPMISYCHFDFNQSDENGGAVWMDMFTNAVIRNSVFANNSAMHLGGAIYFSYGADPVIGGTPEYANDFENNWAGGGSDLAAYYFSPEDPFISSHNRFAGCHQSDYYVSPPSAFDLTGCTSQLTPITQDVYVRSDGDDSNDGLSWATAFRTIRYALENILGTEENPVAIRIGPGIYSPLTTGETYPLPTVDFVTIVGAGIDATILDAEASNRIFYTHRDDFAQIRDLTIRNGSASEGGGIYINRSEIHLDHCKITQNASTASGGGVYIQSSWCEFSDCVISNNQSSGNGGGVLNEGEAGPSFRRCRFDANKALNGYGGGYYNLMFGDQIFDECTFNQNQASGGGGMHLGAKCVLAKITRSIFTDNTASVNGGGIYSGWDVLADISNCLLTGNEAGVKGGAFYLSDDSRISLLECTLTGNSASDLGGAIYCNLGPLLTVTNSILWENESDEIGGNTEYTTVTYSDVTNGFTGTGNIDSDPFFVETASGDFFLSQTAAGQTQNSPCVNSGNDAASAVCFLADPDTVCMDQMTTRTDGITDTDDADMGFHYWPVSPATPTPASSSTPSPTTPPSTTPTDTPSSTPSSSPSGTPTATPTMTCSPTQTQTPPATATGTSAPSSTPTPSPSATPTSTSDPCSTTIVSLSMPSHYFHAGDLCYCKAVICNTEGVELPGYPLYVILDIHSTYFYGPRFTTEPDNYLSEISIIPTGLTPIEVLPEFIWPEGTGSESGIVWFGAITNPEVTDLVGEFGSFEFGWE